ncbi:MAG: phosphatase PAP2 family protein [Bacteroidota bacterium]
MKIERFVMLIYVPILLLGVIGLFMIEKGDMVLYFNERHTPFFDVFFRYYTFVGHGFLYIVPFVISLFIKFRHSAILLATFIIHGILSPVFKRVPLWYSDRPKLYFEDSEVVLNFVEGVIVHTHNSLPSGHTTTAFSFFVVLSLMLKNKTFTIVGALLAVVGGLSRVYLIQHFYIDVVFGAALGTVSAFLGWYAFKNSSHPFLERRLKF